MTEFEKTVSLLPGGREEKISVDEIFEGLSKTALSPHLERMKSTPQNAFWHGEGDVFIHTKMVVEELLKAPGFWEQTKRKREILFISALMHDIGKPICTVTEDGVWRSPNHTVVGSKVARALLWRDMGLSGTEEGQSLRECICTLIRYHGFPLHLSEKSDPERAIIELAAMGEILPDFSLNMLKILVSADLSGRISDDTAGKSEAEYTFMLAEELGVAEKPYPFPDEITRHAYLSGRGVLRDYPLYNDTKCTVIMLSGLPGTGKDRWIKENCGQLPVISLDAIRERLKISPTDREGQGRVIAEAREAARVLLRKNQSFVWNATDLTPDVRGKALSLFEGYNAYTHIVFLETDYKTELKRNGEREKSVPEAVIERLLSKTEPPSVSEAHRVRWLIV